MIFQQINLSEWVHCAQLDAGFSPFVVSAAVIHVREELASERVEVILLASKLKSLWRFKLIDLIFVVCAMVLRKMLILESICF